MSKSLSNNLLGNVDNLFKQIGETNLAALAIKTGLRLHDLAEALFSYGADHNAALSTREKQPAGKLSKILNSPHLYSPYYDTLLARLSYKEEGDAGWATRVLSPLRNLTLNLCQDDHTTIVGCLIRLAVRQWLRDYVWSTWLEKNVNVPNQLLEEFITSKIGYLDYSQTPLAKAHFLLLIASFKPYRISISKNIHV
jgi:hypothetical protein